MRTRVAEVENDLPLVAKQPCRWSLNNPAVGHHTDLPLVIIQTYGRVAYGYTAHKQKQGRILTSTPAEDSPQTYNYQLLRSTLN